MYKTLESENMSVYLKADKNNHQEQVDCLLLLPLVTEPKFMSIIFSDDDKWPIYSH